MSLQGDAKEMPSGTLCPLSTWKASVSSPQGGDTSRFTKEATKPERFVLAEEGDLRS